MEIFGCHGERWNCFIVTTEFPVFHEVSSHPLCNNYTVVSSVILRTWPARLTPSSHNHVCSFYRLGDLQTQPWPQRIKYSPRKTPTSPKWHFRLSAALWLYCMCSFCVCKLGARQRGILFFHGLASPACACFCVQSQHTFVLVVFTLNKDWRKTDIRSYRSPAF